MKPVTIEWIEKAEKDFASALREMRVRSQPNFDLTCFLAQQCIEKYLKARLQEASIRFDKTHDLGALLTQLAPVEPLWSIYQSSLSPLSAFAVVFRYPGRTGTRTQASEAVKQARNMRQVVRDALGMKTKTKRTTVRKRGKKRRS